MPRVLLIDAEGEKQGEMPISAALEAAREAGLDLVEVAPNSVPPVCKILDYGKFRFEEQKKKAETRKKAKRIELKEIKVRPNIDDHDYEVKMKAIHRFFEEGDKVKVTLASADAKWPTPISAWSCSTACALNSTRSPRSNTSRASKAAKSSWSWRPGPPKKVAS